MRSKCGVRRTQSNTAGDVQARRLREQIIDLVAQKAEVSLSPTMTLDQLVRAAAKADVEIFVYATRVRP